MRGKGEAEQAFKPKKEAIFQCQCLCRHE